MVRPRAAAALAATLGAMALLASTAHACACCTNTGQRYVAVENLDSAKRDEIGQIRFGPVALLFTGEADAESVKGIATPAPEYALDVEKRKDRWVLTLRDEAGRSGTLALIMPARILRFEVDPRRGEPEGGHGPVLYREWKLTAPLAATGIFAPSAGRGQQITLVLQGHGNSCAGASDFTHWSLVVSGPVAQYHLCGELVR